MIKKEMFPLTAQYADTDGGTSGNVAFQVRYIGDEASALISVHSSTGDIGMAIGDLSSEAASAATTWKESGGTAGNFDTSDANGNTAGKFLSTIAGLADYEIRGLAAIGADSINAKLLVRTATQCKNTWVDLKWDSSATLFQSGHIGNSDNSGFRVDLYEVKAKNTGSGTTTIKVYDVPNTHAGTLVYTCAGAATTVEKAVTADTETPFLQSNVGSRLVIRYDTTAGACAGYVQTRGRNYKYTS
jgi:hypothetical protein